MQALSGPARTCSQNQAKHYASTSRPTGRQNAWWTRTPPLTSSRHRPPPSTCLVVATGLGLIQPNFWPLRYHWPVPAMERRIQPLGAWIRAFIPACMTPPAVTSCAMKMALTQLTPLQVVLLLGGRFFCQVFRSTFCCVRPSQDVVQLNAVQLHEGELMWIHDGL